MDVQRLIATSRTERQLREAIHVLATTIREAAECLIDLQQAVEALHLAQEPGKAEAIGAEAESCIRSAMRR